MEIKRFVFRVNESSFTRSTKVAPPKNDLSALLE